MSLAERYEEYAEGFEDAYDSDDWDELREFFTEDAVYEGIGEPMSFCVKGVDAILAHLEQSVNDFDRRFESRSLEQRSPLRVDGNTVTMEWAAIYSVEGAPDLRLEGVEIAEFDGDRIIRLEDTFADNVGAVIGSWMAEHGSKLES